MTQQARHDRPDPRLLGHAAQLGGLEGALRGARLQRAHARLPGLRGRGRGAQRRPVADRGADRARDHRAPRERRRRASRRRRSSSATRPAACSRRSCSTTASAPPAWRSTRRRPRASSASRCRRSRRRSRCSRTRPTATARSASRTSSGTTRSPTASPRRSRGALYERYHIPASGSIFWGSALANIHPGKDDTWVDYKNDDRAPLLFISGSDDHLMPPSIQQSNAKHYKSDTITEVKEFEGPHLLPSVAGLGGGRRLRARLGRAPRPRSRARRDDVRSPTSAARPSLIEVGGWRLLTDPTFDPPGRRYRFGWGTGSRKLAGPAIAAAELGPIDAVLLSHDHHDDNLDPAGRALLPSARRRGHHRLGRAAARRRRPRARAVGDDDARGARQAGDRGHGDAVPPRPAAAATRSSAT